MYRFVARIDTPENRLAAEVATKLLDYYRQIHPDWDREVAEEAGNEVVRQILYGQPPSEGMPDLRVDYPRYEGAGG